MINSTPSIEVNQLTVRYNNGHTAIQDITFSLAEHTTCALVGVNGSGKSTLFKSLMGLLQPTLGAVQICNMPVKQALKENLLAYVPQAEEVDWQFPVSVYEVVMMGRYGYMSFLRRPKKIDHEIVNVALEKLQISDLKKSQIGELSGGQKKRVFLARALAQQSPIILLDEPFTGVDAKTEFVIMKLLGELKEEGKLMLVSTHNLGTIPEYCNQVIMINQQLIAHGETDETYTQENLQKTFGGFLRHFNLSGPDLHEDHVEDNRSVLIISDDERPAVFYGDKNKKTIRQQDKQKKDQ